MRGLRGIDAASRAAGWTIAGAIAIAAWWINRRTPLLVAAPACAGLGEWLAAFVVRLAPHQSIGAIVRAIDVAGGALAIALVTRLATSASRSLVAGAAIGLACARLFALTPVYAITDSLAIAAAAGTLLSARQCSNHATLVRRAMPWLLIASSLAIAGFVPGSACLSLPAAPTTIAQHVTSGLHLAFATISPLVIGLAILGVVTIVLDARRDGSLLWLGGYSASAVALAIVSTAPPARLFAPVLASTVVLAGVGLTSFRAAIVTPPTWIRRGVEIAIVLAVAFVRLPSSAPPLVPIADGPLGVDTLSRSTFDYLRRTFPPGAVLVDDDALERILAEESRTPWVDAGPDVVRDAAARGPVVALPPAQGALVHEAFSLQAIAAPGVTGLASVSATGECALVRGTWRDASSLAGANAIAFVAPTTDARGPLTVYLTAATPFSLAPRGWPKTSLRGWYAAAYDRANPDRARALASDMAGDSIPADHPIADAPYVARMELWRVPDAPLILDIALGATSTSALVRASPVSTPARVRLCPSAPVTILPLRVER